MSRKIFVLGNGVDWCEISLKGLLKNNNVTLINKKIPVNSKIKSKIARVVFNYKLNRIIKIPFKSFLYKDVKVEIMNKTQKDDEIVILIYDHNLFGGERTFIKFLRNNFNNIKIVYMFTNIIKFTAANEKKYVDKLNDWYDIVFAFDPVDAEKYNFEYSPLIYDAENEDIKKNSHKNKVFYVGQAKDRLECLIKSYDKLKSLGIDCDFNIANVSDDTVIKKYKNEIIFNKFMSYEDAVEHIKDATCLIDVIQGNSTGLTIKTCEAICYDKKLITTNRHVKEYPFYDEKYIKIIESGDDIPLEFFTNNTDVCYSSSGKEYFSAENFLKRLWRLVYLEK